MAYTTYPGCETTYWPPQQHPYICSPGQYHSFSPQDEQWASWDLLPVAQEQKNYIFQPQMSMLSAHLIMPNPSLDMHQPSDYDRSTRYVSPTASHHSSSFSESSASTEHAPTPDTMHQSTPFAPSATPYPAQHSFRLSTMPVSQHTIWQHRSPGSYAVHHPQSNLSAFASSRPPHPLSEMDMVQHDERGDITMIFDNEVDPVHSKSPMMPQPEELELSEDRDDSNMSSATDNDAPTISTRNSFRQHPSDEETEEDEDPITVDHDSDSDYDNRPHRRRASRTTPRQKHARKSSSNTVISPTFRIHKRTTSSSTVISTTSTSTPRTHKRRTSKSSIKSSMPKPRGPNFPGSKMIPKSDRMYPCTFHRFGCTSEFPNKNEWKRHVACQHLQLGYFRCDLDGCDPDSVPSTTSSTRNGRRAAAHTLLRTQSQSDSSSDGIADEIIKIYNDFNRKDLFTQHCRRMHGPSRNPELCSKPPSKKNGQFCPTKEDEAAFEAQLTEIRARCWHVRRHAPSRSSCGFCKKVFDADYYDTSSTTSTSTSTSAAPGRDTDGNAEEKAWEERMEHVGRHYEKEGFNRDDEEIDEDLVEWGVETGVLRYLADGRPWLVSVEDPSGEGDDAEGAANENGKGSVLSGGCSEEEKERKRARRQPSRTVVRERRVTTTSSGEGDTVVVGGTEGSAE